MASQKVAPELIVIEFDLNVMIAFDKKTILSGDLMLFKVLIIGNITIFDIDV
jgi:hypothetical protein